MSTATETTHDGTVYWVDALAGHAVLPLGDIELRLDWRELRELLDAVTEAMIDDRA